MSKIIQFMHPGKQKNLEKWNEFDEDCDEHSAKFMVSSGKYVDGENTLVTDCKELYFWGEYEAPSKKVKDFKRESGNGMPQSLHRPCYPKNVETSKHLHTTDPFVFGDCFRYMWCMQESFKILRTLEPGDLILFGSRRGNGQAGNAYVFGLDTVFVVGSRNQYKVSYHFDFSQLQDDSCHRDATLIPLNSDLTVTQSFYQGANYEHRNNEMFSFVPAKNSKESFAKFPITESDAEEINQIIAPAGQHAFKKTNLFNVKKSVGITCIETNPEAIKRVCKKIKGKVTKQGYVLGVHFDNPDMKTTK